ncbi:ABC transporter ATP-binding protein [Ornithinimicrobium sp. Arc0846-15]|nr:ABC transporter ATP-binding protein [Ornithinimicrobium laminariae]
MMRVEGLRFTHPGAEKATLDDVSLAVPEGSMTAIVGASGSGKSTLLRVISGLNRPEAGHVYVDEGRVDDLPPERRGLTMMFQKPHLFDHLSVLDNVAFAGDVAGVNRSDARAEAQRCLEMVRLPDMGRRRPRQLSGGQEQRVALARALAAKPHVLLLDEPFSALDTELRHDMHALLGQVRAELKPTIVMVTHDMAEAGLADDVAVLHDSKIAQHAPLAALFAEPASVQVARVIGGFSEVVGTCTDAHHTSALGAWPIRCADDGNSASRQSVMLVRREQVQVSADTAQGPIAGQVRSLTWAGSRQIARVAVGDGLEVAGEVSLGNTVSVGQQVTASIVGQPWCVDV